MDFNKDGKVNILDLSWFLGHLKYYDVNGDLVMDMNDLVLLQAGIGEEHPEWDFNKDGVFDKFDIKHWISEFKKMDINRDGRVDIYDFFEMYYAIYFPKEGRGAGEIDTRHSGLGE